MRGPLHRCACVGGLVHLFCAVAIAGSLTPPAGPVSETLKPLSVVEPRTEISDTNTPGDASCLFRITAPGSYYLSGNIAGVAGKSGIIIAADNVSLDLMGFAMLGSAGSATGVTTDDTRNRISIRNGSIVNWGGSGVLMAGVILGEGLLLENLHVAGNGGNGVAVNMGSVVRSCTFNANAGSGLSSAFNVVLEACSARGNGGTGFVVGFGSTIRDCSSMENNLSGFSGSGVFENCVAMTNLQNGYTVNASVLTNCRAEANTNLGISVGSESVLTGCSAGGNGSSGVSAGARCILLNNISSQNSQGGAGANFRVSGVGCRLEGNQSIDGLIGFQITSTRSLVIRNSSKGATTNWSIVADNNVAPIVTAATNAAVITGDTYAGSLGSTDPNANYTH